MASSLVQIMVMFGIPMVLIFTGSLLIILIVALFFHLKRGRKIDALELLSKDMIELAKINLEPNMLELHRTPSEKKHEGAYPVIFKGRIAGYNRINLYTSFEELYQPHPNEKGMTTNIEEKEHPLSKEEIKAVKDLMEQCGGYLNVIVYDIDLGWSIPYLKRNTITRTLLCFDDQVSGLSSADGHIILHAPGTETHGCYFEIASGSKDRTKVIISAIETMTWIRLQSLTLSNIFNVADQSININPGLKQMMALKQTEKKVKEVA